MFQQFQLVLITVSLACANASYSVSSAYHFDADTFVGKPNVVALYKTVSYYVGFNGDSLEVEVAPRKCYNLEGSWDNTVNSIDTRGFCVILYDKKDCKGDLAIRMDRYSYSYFNLANNYFGNLASSLRLCEPDRARSMWANNIVIYKHRSEAQ